jgi:high-affinity iron transporter
MELSSALPTFVVTLREGVEAALVVGIVLACLKAAGQQALYRWVYAGIGAGIVGSVVIGLLLGGTLQGLTQSDLTYAPVIQEFLAAGFGIMAIFLLSWMLVWMTKQAKSLKGEVQQRVQKALQAGGGWQVFTLILIAVLREGFETVLFIVARFSEGVGAATVGAIAGLTIATLIGFALFRLGVKINLRLFFQVMGIFLLLIIGGLVISVFKDIDKGIAVLTQINPQYGYLCFSRSTSCILGAQLWDASGVLPDHEFPGIVLKALFGYREKLYLVQGIAYVALITTVGSFYWRSLGAKVIPAGSRN